MKNKTISIIGAVLILFASFSTTVKVPVLGGTQGYLYTGAGSVAIILCIFLLSLIFIILQKYKLLLIPGIASLLKVLFLFYYSNTILIKLQKIYEQKYLKENPPPKGLEEALINQPPEYLLGITLLFIGGVLLILASKTFNKENINHLTNRST